MTSPTPTSAPVRVDVAAPHARPLPPAPPLWVTQGQSVHGVDLAAPHATPPRPLPPAWLELGAPQHAADLAAGNRQV
jgi:hypothetical protein